MGTPGRGLRTIDRDKREERMGAVPTRTYKMSATAERFHNSTAKNKGAMGPVGNGKTVFVMHDLLFRSEGQVPDPRDNVRRSRWFVIRNTYQQLMNSTVKSWLEWFPDTVMKYSPHPVGLLRRPSMRNDGTSIEIGDSVQASLRGNVVTTPIVRKVVKITQGVESVNYKTSNEQ